MQVNFLCVPLVLLYPFDNNLFPLVGTHSHANLSVHDDLFITFISQEEAMSALHWVSHTET